MKMKTPLKWGSLSVGLFTVTPVVGLMAAAPAVFAEQAPKAPDVQLAKVLETDQITSWLTGYWFSEKLDGVRGIWDGKQLLTRSGLVIDAPKWFTQGLPEFPVEGELWIERGAFDRVSGIVRTGHEDPEWPAVKFMLFDRPNYGGTYQERRSTLSRWVNKAGLSHVAMIEAERLADPATLLEKLKAIQEAGGEGIMLNHPLALYQAGRSDGLLKLKGYQDAEAKVIGYTDGKGKYEGKVGALIVQTRDGRSFRVGSGLTDQMRNRPPEVGSFITYRYNGVTDNGLPRFARFERVYQPES
jgi:DNA ligase-1